MASGTQRKASSYARQRQPLEKHVTAAILKYLNALPGCYAIKTHGGQWSSGQPDILGCLDGRALALEVKRPKASGRAIEQTPEGWKRAGATALQVVRLQDWQRAGAIVGVITSVEETERIIQAGSNRD